jgi:hypothetical protein
MKRSGLVVTALVSLVLGFVLGAVVPALRAAPRVGDAKFENQFIKTFVATPEKPLIFRVAGGDYTAVSVTGVEDDYVVLQLRSKDPATAYVRIRDIAGVAQPTN